MVLRLVSTMTVPGAGIPSSSGAKAAQASAIRNPLSSSQVPLWTAGIMAADGSNTGMLPSLLSSRTAVLVSRCHQVLMLMRYLLPEPVSPERWPPVLPWSGWKVLRYVARKVAVFHRAGPSDDLLRQRYLCGG